MLRVGNFYTNDSWYYSDLELGEKYYADYGDLLYTWSATFGPHIWLGDRVIYHYHIWKIDLSNQLEKQFAVQLLEQDKANILSSKNGSTMVHITKEGMEQKDVIIPPSTKEQQEIGAFFQQLDNLITLHQRQPFLHSTPEISLTVQLIHPFYTSSWEQRKLGDISEIKTGPFGSTLHADDYVSDGTPIITTEHFKTGSLPRSKNGLPQVSDSDYKRLAAYTLDNGDIVFSRVGSVDINALITPFQSNWLFSGRVLRVRPQTDISSQFLHTRLETESIKTDIRTRAVGQTMPSINTEILKITPLVLPSSEAEQEQIGSYFAALDNLITLHQRKGKAAVTGCSNDANNSKGVCCKARDFGYKCHKKDESQ